MDLLAPTRARVAWIEAAAADALRPAEEQLEDGWRFRFDRSVRRRGNSVLAERRGTRSLQAKIRDAVTFYAARGVPARVQLSAASRPARLDAHLGEAGWQYEPGARVMFRACAAGDERREDPREAAFGVRIAAKPDEGYRSVQTCVTPGAGAAADARAGSLHARGLVPRHATARDAEGRAVSAGLGVHDPERGLLGIFGVATIAPARGRGAGGRVLSALLGEAARKGAAGCYLQVDVRNEVAARLYQRAGFYEHHRYHYRTLRR